MDTHTLLFQTVLLFGSDEKLPIPEGLLAFILQLHSIFRYLILITLILAIYFAFQGKKTGAPYSGRTKKAGFYTMILADLQLLMGLVLYAIYLYTSTGFKIKRLKDQLEVSSFRFFILEHAVIMFIALVLIHIGYAKAKKAESAITANKSQFTWFLIALILILVAIPWPFMPGYGRPWF